MNQPKYKFGDTLWRVCVGGSTDSLVVDSIRASNKTYKYNDLVEEDYLFPTPKAAKEAMEACRFHEGDEVWIILDEAPVKTAVTAVSKDSDGFVVLTNNGFVNRESDIYATQDEALEVLRERCMELLAGILQQAENCRAALKLLDDMRKEQE